jgi:peptide chain release factor 1
MSHVPREKLTALVSRWETIQADLSRSLDQPTYVRLSKEFAELNPVVSVIRALHAAEKEEADLEAMLADTGADEEMRALAVEDLATVAPKREKLEQDLRILLLPRDEADDKNVILEVRAGTGGEEAALFAADLYRMYLRYADIQGWKSELISLSESDLGGYKEVIANISGKGVFAKLKFESGVHRVQRVPETEGSGRIHTSAATVAVLPEAAEIDIEVRSEDIRIDTMRSSGAGGQHVNTTDSAVRITHLPTGIVVTSSEKSQHRNREIAMGVLRTRLYDLERQKLHDARSADRKAQVGTGDRSERIRTYNFPQGRMTDHRINLTLYKLDQVMQGDLDDVIDALTADAQARLMAEAEDGAMYGAGT